MGTAQVPPLRGFGHSSEQVIISAMRYRLRTLLILLALMPLAISWGWFVVSDVVLRSDQSPQANYARSKAALDSGRIFLGMPVSSFLDEYSPHATCRYQEFTVYDLGPSNDYYGCTLIARDGQLIYGAYSECTKYHEYFSAIERAKVQSIFEHIPPL